MPKIYTRTGDDGTTALFGGERVRKGHPRIDAYGTVDEVNSFVGLARAHLQASLGNDRLDAVLSDVQNDLFVVGADLATPTDAKPVVPRVKVAHVDVLEAHIDAFEDDLPALKNFILPGGTPGAAALHTARTVCRRAERLGVQASASTPLNEHALTYLNRLSDLFFVLARWANRQAGTREERWTGASTSSDAAAEETS
ncbi:cob(I)yrinic acid a,c-diamide adenosyltransferase [Salisaeta longa]|uniref:cob(I)yrinic acid a,c-diamide adenosyltransferase n=1 Tax=Salisaeta longa TaxID=503170 RepID=UPI0003B37A13|nr:cob(I)yrinic acid a,c-diamide adenosyltransferase [Salisaeta longa]